MKKVKDLNWCEFTIDSLISCTNKWKRQPKGAYRGPLLFLMLCYVDRVLCKKRMTGREFPILANWTSKDLWAQINFELDSCQGFGKGIEDDRIKAPETPTLYIQKEEADIRAKKACVQKISRSLKNFARSVTEVVDAVSKAQHMFSASTQMEKV